MRIIVISILLLSITGCSRNWCANHYPTKDSVNVSYIEKIDTAWLQMPADTTYIETPIDCPDQQIVVKEGSNTTQIVIKDKVIKVFRTSKADSLMILSLRSQLKEFELKEKIVYKDVPYIPKWIIFALVIESVILVLLVFRRVKRFFGF